MNESQDLPSRCVWSRGRDNHKQNDKTKKNTHHAARAPEKNPVRTLASERLRDDALKEGMLVISFQR